jgi:hypothetical protein
MEGNSEGECIKSLLVFNLSWLCWTDQCLKLRYCRLLTSSWLLWYLSLFYLCLIISDIFSCSNPSYSWLLCFLFRIDKRFHSIIKKRVWLHKVDKMECVLLILLSVWYSEVKPLCHISGWSMIIFQIKLIFIKINLFYFFEVSTLKSTFKN